MTHVEIDLMFSKGNIVKIGSMLYLDMIGYLGEIYYVYDVEIRRFKFWNEIACYRYRLIFLKHERFQYFK